MDDYTTLNTLHFAQQDAATFYGSLLSLPEPFLPENVTILFGPTRDQILKEMKSASQGLERGDLLVFYFSGHAGSGGKSLQFFLRDYTPDEEHASIGHWEIIEKIDGPFDMLIVQDACRTTGQKGGAGGAAQNPETWTSGIERDLSPSKGRASGHRVTLSGCSDRQSSAEHKAIRSGLFTRAMMEVLKENQCIDYNFSTAVNSRMVEVAEKHRLVKAQTAQITCAADSPIMLSAPIAGTEAPNKTKTRVKPASADKGLVLRATPFHMDTYTLFLTRQAVSVQVLNAFLKDFRKCGGKISPVWQGKFSSDRLAAQGRPAVSFAMASAFCDWLNSMLVDQLSSFEGNIENVVSFRIHETYQTSGFDPGEEHPRGPFRLPNQNEVLACADSLTQECEGWVITEDHWCEDRTFKRLIKFPYIRGDNSVRTKVHLADRSRSRINIDETAKDISLLVGWSEGVGS